MGFDGVALVVVDRSGLYVVPWTSGTKTLDVEQPVVGADHELRGHAVLLGQAARLVMCPFRPATARALASNALFTVRVPPESWTSDEPAAQHDRSVQSPWS